MYIVLCLVDILLRDYWLKKYYFVVINSEYYLILLYKISAHLISVHTKSSLQYDSVLSHKKEDIYVRENKTFDNAVLIGWLSIFAILLFR